MSATNWPKAIREGDRLMRALIPLALMLSACAAEATSTTQDPAVSAEATAWTPERFDRWVEARAGTGEPVYWYSTGTLRAFPGGELLYTVEGYDAAIGHRVSDTLAEQYSRKIYIYRDPETGDVVRTVNGEDVEPIAYPYQFITYELKTDGDAPYLQTFVEQGRAPRVQTIGPGTDLTVHDFGNMTLYTAPLFLDFPIGGGKRYQTFENYDFIVPHDEDETAIITFMRYGPLPGFAVRDGITDGAMHLKTWRIDDYADVPEGFREYIEADAPLWKTPPADRDAIRALQAPE